MRKCLGISVQYYGFKVKSQILRQSLSKISVNMKAQFLRVELKRYSEIKIDHLSIGSNHACENIFSKAE